MTAALQLTLPVSCLQITAHKVVATQQKRIRLAILATNVKRRSDMPVGHERYVSSILLSWNSVEVSTS